MLVYGEIYCQRCGTTWYGPKCGVKYCKECRRIVDIEKVNCCNQKKQAKKRIQRQSSGIVSGYRKKSGCRGIVLWSLLFKAWNLRCNMKYMVYASAIRCYETVIEADSKEEAERIAKIMYNENEMNDYEDELTSIEVVEE